MPRKWQQTYLAGKLASQLLDNVCLCQYPKKSAMHGTKCYLDSSVHVTFSGGQQYVNLPGLGLDLRT